MLKYFLLLLFLPFGLFSQGFNVLSTQLDDLNTADAYDAFEQQVARDDSTSKFFLDGNVGAFLVLADYGDLVVHVDLGGGYLVTPTIGLGLEVTGGGRSGSASGLGMYGLGGFARFQFNRFFFKQSYGRVFHGSRSSEYSPNERSDYIPSGQYFSTSLLYQLKKGLKLGMNYTFVNKLRFDYYSTDDIFQDSGQLLKFRDELVDEFGGLTFIVGYTLPN